MSFHKPNEPQRPRQPEDPTVAPDTASAYERAHPEKEAGMGRLDNNEATPAQAPDQVSDAVKNKHSPRTVTAEETAPERDKSQRLPAQPGQPDHSMHEEQPLSEDTAPQDIQNKRMQRHPRHEGKGGVP